MMKKNKLWSVVKEVYRKNVLTGGFIFMVLFPLILMGIFIGIGKFATVEIEKMGTANIAVIGSDEESKNGLTEALKGSTLKFDLSEEAANKELLDNKIDGYLILKKKDNKFDPLFYRKTDSKDISLGQIEKILENIQFKSMTNKLGITEDNAKELIKNKVSVPTLSLKKLDDGSYQTIDSRDFTNEIKRWLGYIVCIVIVMFIMNYVGLISQEIAGEKGSRIMEIILSSINATTHFFGKMLGILFVILTQILIYIGIYFIGRRFLKDFDIGKTFGFGSFSMKQLINISGEMFTYSIIYAILGVLIYTVMAGFLGSLVSRTEDIQKMILPVTFTALAGFYIGMFAFITSNNPLVRISSQIPFFTPFVMPFRIANGTASQWELNLSIVLSIIFAIVLFIIAAKFYKTNVLTYSDKGLIYNIKRSIALMREEEKSKTN